MAIGKPRGKKGMRPVYVYDPAIGRKRYVGSRQALRGQEGAQELERQKIAEFQGKPEAAGEMTCGQYADRWLSVKHGEGTRRPATTTEQVNRGLLKPFRAEFGDRLIRGGISREEALDWCKDHQQNAKAVSAMFNDALDDGRTDANPFGNRRLPERRGRKDIEPLTEDEIETLCELAIAEHGKYGLIVAGWIKLMAWAGPRPGETATREWSDIDLENGRLVVPRIKGNKQRDTVVLPPAAAHALLAMPTQRSGHLFLTPQGKPYNKGSFGYYWRPIRTAFRAKLQDDRRRDLARVKGALDVYALRHFCGSLMADRGLSEFDIAHQLGNSPQVCRETYIHTHRDRANDRVAMALGSNIVDLQARRKGA